MVKASDGSSGHADEGQQVGWQSSPLWGLDYEERYTAALGRMLVLFNKLEMGVDRCLNLMLSRLGVPELYRVDDKFLKKVDLVQLALCAFPSWPKPDFKLVRKVNTLRNNLAHGYFHLDQAGIYQTRSVHKKDSSKTIITPDEIQSYADEVRTATTGVDQLLFHLLCAEIEDTAPDPLDTVQDQLGG